MWSMFVARDKSGNLCLFPFLKPTRLGDKWHQGSGLHSCVISNNFSEFKDLTWEDEPVEVMLIKKL